jgi:ABC-type nitrate/sulfonate/bicarbonate transport system permease component
MASVPSHASQGSIALALVGFGGLAIVWHVAAILVALPTILPEPYDVAVRALSMAGEPLFLQAAVATIGRWLAGFGAGAVVGFVLGLLIGSTAWSRKTFLPTIDFLRSIPVSIAFPVFLLAFGLSDAANIAMAFAATVFLVSLNVAVGASAPSGDRLAFLQVMRARWLHRLLYLQLPEATHNFVIGLRATLSLSLIVVLVSEMFVGTRAGLGQLAYNSYLQSSPVTLFAVILWVGLAGAVANAAFSFASELALRRLAWR